MDRQPHKVTEAEMKLNPKYMTAGATIVAAAVTAHLMQRDGPNVTPLSAVSTAEASMAVPPINIPLIPRKPNQVTMVSAVPGPISDETAATKFPMMPRPPQDAMSPAPLPQNGVALRSRMSVTTPAPVADAVMPVDSNEFGLACGPMLTASAEPAAMIGVTLTAPCRGGQQFNLRQGDLVFTARMSGLGTYTADIPALDQDVALVVSFPDGEKVSADVSVADADTVDRVVLLSQGQTGLQIHALEFGADYDQAGHVWAGNPRDTDGAERAGGGFITELGDDTITDANLAEVYTFPANTRDRDGVVRLSIETEVTAYNCGKEISGQTMQKNGVSEAKPVTLTLDMPDCDAIGEFLVLKNLLRDLKIASN
jgi:hypothetical protein